MNKKKKKDQFIEGKIGSAYMSTLEGQPNLEDFVENTKQEENPMKGKKNNIKDY